MADVTQKWEANCHGRFFTDKTCIACDACTIAAPENFKMHENGYAYVAKQPETQQEINDCNEAMQGCPVEAIGET